MSEPKRYTDLQVWEALYFAGSTNGWIRWEDYARLKAEVERLTAELSSTTAWGRWLESDLSHARVEISFLKAEVERLSAADSYLQSANEYSFEQRCDELEAEVERLHKAGDAMASALILFEMKSEEERQDRIKAWSAAKEGKQP